MECKIDNCERKARTRGMCKPHYEAWKIANPELVQARHLTSECEVNDCDRNSRAATVIDGQRILLCSSHYYQNYRGLNLTDIKPYKTSYIDEKSRRCTYCDEVKPNDEFYDNSSKTGKQSNCKDCFKAVSTFNAGIKAGNVDKCLRAAGSMPESIQLKYLDRLSTAINEGVLA